MTRQPEQLSLSNSVDPGADGHHVRAIPALSAGAVKTEAPRSGVVAKRRVFDGVEHTAMLQT
jgi:hypothetical protein